MAVTRRHGFYAVEAGTLIGGITAQNVNTGTEVRGEASSDRVSPAFRSIVAQKPRGSFTTLNIAQALTITGATGVDIASLANGLRFYAQKHADSGSTRAAGAVHRRYTMSAGLLAPRSLSANHGDDATLSYDALAKYDGVNDPLVEVDNVSLPSGLTDERFTLAKVTLGGILLDSKVSLDVEFGIQANSEGADSDIWDTFLDVATIVPRLTLRGVDIEWLKAANIPFAGRVGTHANTTFYLRQRLDQGTFHDPSAPKHIQFTMDGVIHIDDAFDGSPNAPAGVGVVMESRFDGTNDPLTVTVNTAIQ
ncbi:MAG: hypothetical protein ACE5E6_09400 [Phycisphaerae bacterium]